MYKTLPIGDWKFILYLHIITNRDDQELIIYLDILILTLDNIRYIQHFSNNIGYNFKNIKTCKSARSIIFI